MASACFESNELVAGERSVLPGHGLFMMIEARK
jgi:hypothetical protein